jgi:hypothetical protein
VNSVSVRPVPLPSDCRNEPIATEPLLLNKVTPLFVP